MYFIIKSRPLISDTPHCHQVQDCNFKVSLLPPETICIFSKAARAFWLLTNSNYKFNLVVPRLTLKPQEALHREGLDWSPPANNRAPIHHCGLLARKEKSRLGALFS